MTAAGTLGVRGGAGKPAEAAASSAPGAAPGPVRGKRATAVRESVRIPDEQHPGPRLAPRLARVLSAQAIPANHVGAGAIPAARDASPGWRGLPGELRARLAPIVGSRAIDAARLHTGPAAHARAAAHQARAVADGLDVYFADGEYRPGTRAGDALIAHELAHVDQAQRGLLHRPARKAMGGADHDALEAAADRAGDQLSAGADVEKHKRPERDRKAPGAAARDAVARHVAATVAVARDIVKDAAAKDAGAKPAAPAEAATVEDAAAAGPKAKVVAPLELLMPEPPTELSARERKRVGGVKGRAATTATATATAPTGKENVDYAEARVQVPQTESDARAAQKIATELVATEPPSPEIVALCNKISKLIEGKRPSDKEGVLDDPAKEIAEQQGAQVQGNVQKNVQDANDSLAAVKTTPQGPQPPTAEAIQPLPEHVDAPQVNATAATPDPVPPEQVSLDADATAMDTRAEDAGLHQETAQLVQSGPVRDARDARGEMQSLASDGAAEALKQQDAALTQANTNMAALQAQAVAAMATTRTRHVTGVKTQQDELKGGEEALKIKLSDEATLTYKGAQTQVEALLKDVPGTAMAQWRAGLPLISTAFNDDILQIRADIARRHSRWTGKLKAAKDWAFGLPGWVTRGYDAAEKKFGKSVCDLILGISAQVNTVIKACQVIIETARQRIADIFTKDLPAGLETWAAEQKLGFDKKLDQLQTRTESTRDKFNKELIQNAGEAVQAARERIQALRKAAKGALSRFADAVGRFLDDPIRFIIDGLLELVGISPKSFWAMIDKISAVISDIAWHPIRFISNLMDGVGAGFDLFFSHFAKHAREGFFKWLFRGLKDLGVEVPADFSLKSIITFFLQLMGLSWLRIRKMLGDVIGEKYVAAAEKVLKLAELIALGPEGVLKLIEDKLTPEAIFGRILDMALDYVVTTLIKTVAKYIIKLLNPVGAVLAAIEAVYKIAKWIFQNAASIFHFIEAVVNTLAAVVAGDTATVAKGVELGLAMLIPPVIDFLASLLDLGDLPEKVADIVKSLQSWVEGIVKSIIKTLVEAAKSLLASIGIGKKEGDKAQQAPGKIGETLSFTSEGESHKLYIDVAGSDARVMVASSPMTVASWLDHVQTQANKLTSADDKKEADRLIALARTQLGQTDASADDAAKVVAAPPRPDAPAGAPVPSPELEHKVEKAEESLRDTLDRLGKMFGGPDVIKAVAVKQSVAFGPPYKPNLILDIDETGGGAIYTSSVSDETQIKKAEKAGGEGAFDKTTGTLTLPAIRPTALESSVKLTGMGSTIGEQTFARKVLFSKLGDQFAIDVGFDFFARSALTGRVLLTPEKRLVEFAGKADKAKFAATAPRYKPPGDGATPYPETSSRFQNSEYLKHFTDARSEQKLDGSDAGGDLARWLSSSGAGRGQLSRVGTASAVTYILTRGGPFSEIVIDTQSDEIDPVLQKAVLRDKIVPFMKKLAQGQTVDGIDLKKLETELWPHGGNARWLADRFRDYNQSVGAHEWIPSSAIPRTIARAAAASDWIKGEKWIDLHHEMRAPTGDLIGKPTPEYWQKVDLEGRSFWRPQGHDGAVEHDIEKAQSKNFGPKGPFHKALFDNIENCGGLSDCIAGARKVFADFIWNNEEPLVPIDRQLKIRGARVSDVQALKADQAARYKAIIDHFDDLARTYKD